MQALAPISDHVEQALGTLSDQFVDASNLRAVVSAASARIQALEDVAQQLLLKRTLDAAEGAQLDILGQVIGQVRLGSELDPTYRAKLRAAVLRNHSTGTADELSAVAMMVVSALSVHSWDSFPAGLGMAVSVSSALGSAEELALEQFMVAAKAAGVELVGLCWYSGKVFGFSEDTDPLVAGLDDGTGLVTAGTFASFIYP